MVLIDMKNVLKSDPNSPMPWYYESLDITSDTLVIAFSSSNEIFEWSNTLNGPLSHLNLKKIYIMDNWNVWWHGIYKGIDGYGPHPLVNFFEEKK